MVHQVIKENMETGKREVLLNGADIPKSKWDFTRSFTYMINTRLILYNEELFIPYWSGGFAEADEVPYDFAVMKMKTDGKDFAIMKEPSGGDFRDLFIWNDRMYFTHT